MKKYSMIESRVAENIVAIMEQYKCLSLFS